MPAPPDEQPAGDIANMLPSRPEDPMREPMPGLRRPDSPVDGRPATPRPAKTQSPGMNRPPKPPGKILGPYIHFKTTTPDRRWTGSVLVLHRQGTSTPEISFDYDVKQSVQTLYEDVFGMIALRFDISMPIPDGLGDQPVTWTMRFDGNTTSNTFSIPRWEQKWRGGFFSCNGFDETVPQETVELLGFDNVWKHLNSVHKESPLHVLMWGGDQIYIDFIFADIPFLKRWLKMEWDVKWHHEFSEETSTQVAEYYFNTYQETWERSEVKFALQTMPSLMVWDDHDIFDGAGSYPPELHDSPVMLGLFRTAKKFRLLFQHHTTERLASSHGLFGVQSQNFIGQCGPRMAIVMPDGRSERNHLQVHDKRSIDMIFDRLETGLAPTTQHLIVGFAVPFSFIRVRPAESLFNFLAAQKPWVRQLPGVKSLNSIFDLPEFYDDLLDEWCHDSHIDERNDVLVRLQDFAKRHDIRVTFLSGDVHCAAFAMFRSDKATRDKLSLKPEADHKLMYQVISSAIVNQAPSPNACIGYHYIANSWEPVKGTEESLVEMFERRPEQGKRVRHRKVMPNRNWTFWEEVGSTRTDPGPGEHTANGNGQVLSASSDGTAPAGGGVGEQTASAPNGAATTTTQDMQQDQQKHHHHLPGHDHHHRHKDDAKDLDWHRYFYAFDRKKGYPSTLGPSSKPNGLGTDGKPVHQHKHGLFCHHKNSKLLHRQGPQLQTGTIDDRGNASTDPASGLRVRMWLESRRKEPQGRQFASYETIIPNLSVSKAQKIQ